MASKIDLFFETFSTTLSAVLSQALTTPWQVNVVEASEWLDGVTVSFDAAPCGGSVTIQMSRIDAIRVADLFVGNVGVEGSEWNSDRQEAFEELARQIVGRFTTAIKGDFGELCFAFTAKTPSRAAEKRTFAGVSPDGSRVHFEVSVTAQVVDFVSRKQQSSDSNSEQSTTTGKNLGLLMDVELPASLRFGQRHMLLREVLELSSGAVIELDRQVNDPVELLIDGKVIARGDLVVVDGAYGIRVSQVASPAHRVSFIS